MVSKVQSLISLLLIISLLAGCTSIPHLENRLVEHAAQEKSAKTRFDTRFKEECSDGSELYNISSKKISIATKCLEKIFDETILDSARYPDLAKELKTYIISQNDEYSKKKISKKTFKARILKAWKTYNTEWEKRSKQEVIDSIAQNEKTEQVAKGAVAVVAVVGLIALAAAGGGGSGNSFANNYSGNCACPGDIAADGTRCGYRSAYSRNGGASPYCPAYRM